jgi:MoaA/NifB/PqqE/SkfB family radical SAM enzyme
MQIFRSDKIVRHEALGRWLDGGNPFPVTVEIDPSGACNSRCPRCAGGHRRDRLPTSRALDLLDELAAGGTRAVTFTGGGEPTLHPDLPEMIRRATDAGLAAALITNGLSVSDEVIDTAASRCSWVRVSLDAGTQEGYALSHGGTPDEFVAAQTTIRRLAEVRGRRATVGVGVLHDDRFTGQMRAATLIASACGADYVQFRPYYLAPWYGGPESIDVPAFRRELARCEALARPGRFAVLHSADKYGRLESGDLDRSYARCHGAQFCSVVQADGTVALCCLHRGSPRHALGNIYENDFADIWASPRRAEVAEALDIPRECPPLCRCDAINERLEGMLSDAPQHAEFL